MAEHTGRPSTGVVRQVNGIETAQNNIVYTDHGATACMHVCCPEHQHIYMCTAQLTTTSDRLDYALPTKSIYNECRYQRHPHRRE